MARRIQLQTWAAIAVAAAAPLAHSGVVTAPVTSGLEFMIDAWANSARLDWSPSAGTQSLDLTSVFVVETDGDLTLAPGAQTHYETINRTASGAPLIAIDLRPADFTGNVDPLIAYGMQVVNNGVATATFQKTVTAPILPVITSSPTIVRAGLSGSLFDAAGDGVTVAPNPNLAQDVDGIPEMQIFRVRQTVGSGAWTNSGVDVGLGQTFSGGGSAFTYTYPAVNLPYQAGPTGTFAQMQTRTRFTLTPNGDRATFTGFAEILPVPEPGTWAMMVAGLLAVGWIARRQAATQGGIVLRQGIVAD